MPAEHRQWRAHIVQLKAHRIPPVGCRLGSEDVGHQFGNGRVPSETDLARIETARARPARSRPSAIHGRRHPAVTPPYRWAAPTYLTPSAESPVAICESPSCTTDATSAPSRVNTLPRPIARPPALDATCCE